MASSPWSTPTLNRSFTPGDGSALPDPQLPVRGDMPFLDHLEELRWRIIKALGAVVVSSVACLFYADWVVDQILMAPTRQSFVTYGLLGIEAHTFELLNRTITGQFFAYFGTVLAVGVLLAMPVVIYQLWRFIEPALYPSERKSVRFAAVFATFFFVLGVLFGYYLMTPLAIQFFAGFTISEQIVNQFDITRYFSMIVSWTFGAGLLFELPVVVLFLAKIGVLSPAWMRTQRKYALIVILIIAALFTPPDPFSQTLMAVPLLLLYELSIVIAARVEKKRLRERALQGEALPTPG